ncbi:MAG: hypothetical protein II220_03380, partial [Spirochaetales bacterium]|nr:hypothetical protein [Spirochaetales bacterium]
DEKGKPKLEKRPNHPTAKKLGSLYKNDYVEFVDNGIWYKARIAGLRGSDGRVDYRPIYAVTDCNDWIIATSDKMTETCWKQQKGNNYISVNVLFGEKQARIITVNPIGRVYRKKC